MPEAHSLALWHVSVTLQTQEGPQPVPEQGGGLSSARKAQCPLHLELASALLSPLHFLTSVQEGKTSNWQ